MANTFTKKERLKSRKIIEQLFAGGESFNAFPLKVLYKNVPLDAGSYLQATVAVSSRHFKKAVDRNRIKRLLREVYRTQKSHFQQHLQASNSQLALFIIYTGKQLPTYNVLLLKMHTVLNHLLETQAGDRK